MNSNLIASLCASILPFQCFAAKDKKQTKDEHPNVLMVVVDDWGANDLSFTGSKFYETPNIDKLSSEATTFNQAYVAYPRSVPSRFSLWTGMHCARPQKVGKEEADERKVDENTYCMAEGFKAADYSTFFLGKWHLATDDCLPQNKGFDINIGGGKAGAPGSYFAPFNNPKGGKKNKEKDIEGMLDAKSGEYLTDYMTRKMVDYIDKKHEKSFFAVCSYYAVHTPLEAKEELIEKYRKKRKALKLQDDPFMEEEAGVRKTQQDDPVYAAMIESVDTGVGEMIKALKKNGLYDNTIILIVSDHGGLSNRGKNNRVLATTNSPLKAGKGHLYEGGVRVPLLVKLPQQNKAIKSDDVVSTLDVLPTLSVICSFPIAKNATIDGVSFSSILKNKQSEALNKRKLFWHKASERPGSTGDYLSTAVRSGDYKLINFYQQGRVELYNIKNDIGETTNLANKEPELVKQLLADIDQWKDEVGVRSAVQKEHKGKNAEKRKEQKKADRKNNKEKKNKDIEE